MVFGQIEDWVVLNRGDIYSNVHGKYLNRLNHTSNLYKET